MNLTSLFCLSGIGILALATSLIASNPKLRQSFADWPTLDGNPPKLLGHAGERFYLPEHTTGSYELAAIEGADYVEPDLVLTKDKILVCFHDLALKRTTNVESFPEFAHLRGNHSVIVDGKNSTIFDDWLVVDFTLKELQMLRVQQQPNGVRLQYFNNLFPIATFQEFLDSVHKLSWKLGKPIGIIPELKQPQFHNVVFNQESQFMETKVLRALKSNGYPIQSQDIPDCQAMSDSETNQTQKIQCGPIILQCFDKNSLKYLSTQVSHNSIELMMLIHPDVYLLTPAGFQEVAEFTDYLCLWKEYMYTGVEPEIDFRGWDYDPDIVATLGGFFKAEEFIPEAHRLSMKMAIFTIPDSRENSGRGCAIKCDPTDREEEMFYYFKKGVDAIFVENIPEATALRMKFDFELRLANLTWIQ